MVCGTKFRTFNVIDDFNREVLNIEIDTSLGSKRITRELDKIIDWRGLPEMIRTYYGPEFTSYTFVEWAKKRDIELLYIKCNR